MIYDHAAAVYDRLLAPFERSVLARWRRETLSFLPTDAVLLEIGAGTGANFPFYPSSTRAVASELSFEMISRAAAKDGTKTIIQCGAENLPFDENSFDAAFATLVLCSVSDPLRVFAELQRVIKPGGVVVLLEHVRPPRALGWCFDALNILTTALIDDCFNRRTAELAAHSGLRILEVRTKFAGIVNLIVCEVEKPQPTQTPTAV